MKKTMMIALLMGMGLMLGTYTMAKGGDCCTKDAVCCVADADCCTADAVCTADADCCTGDACTAACCDGGDKKARVESSTESLLATFVPEKRAELEAKKALQLKRESELLLSGSKLAPIPNPEGKPNRMMDDAHKGGNGAPSGKTARTRGGR